MKALVAALALSAALGSAQGQDDLAARAFALRMDGKVDEAKALLEAELAKAPTNGVGWFELARVEFQRCMKTKELDSAARAIENAFTHVPGDARVHCMAGQIRMYRFIMLHHEHKTGEMLAEMKKAIVAFEQALKLDPDLHEARLLLIACYGNNPEQLGGDRGKALAQIEELARRSPIHAARARCDLEAKDPRQRLALFAALEREHADDPELHELLARQHAALGDLQQALAHADRACALDANRVAILLELAVVFAMDKEFENATVLLARFQSAIPAAPRALRAYAFMLQGRIQERQGQRDESARSLQQARELDAYCWPTMQPPPRSLFCAP